MRTDPTPPQTTAAPAAHASAMSARRRMMLALLGGVALVAATPLSAATQSTSLRSDADAAGVFLGAAVDGTGLNDQAYRDLLTEQVNLLSTRGDLSMAVVQPEPGVFNFSAAEAIVDFAVEADLKLRGHELLGGAIPSWVASGTWTAETLTEVLRTHVTEVITHFRERNPGAITQWDVVGDAFLPDGTPRPTVWQQVIGDSYLSIAFEAAREADPDAELFYDDFYDDLAVTQDAVASGVAIMPGANSERTTCDTVPKCVAVRDRIAQLVAAGVPIDGIGFQSHLFSPDPADLAQFSTWVDDIGLRWAVTEFDVPLPVTEIDDPVSLEYQAGVYAAALTACADAPGCNTFVTWGISDRFSPIPAATGGAFGGALWFDANDAPKPAFGAMAEVLAERVIPAATTLPPPPPPESTLQPTTVPEAIGPTDDDAADDDNALVAVVTGLAALGAIAAVVVVSRRRRQTPDAKNP